MTYTPINWQNGDIITAEKMNKMDNGWGVESTQLFSETVTTSGSDPAPSGTLVYSSPMTESTINATFDNSDYVLPLNVLDWGNVYGEVGESGPVFSTYPFCIVSSILGSTAVNSIYTETAGSHNLSVSASAIETSEDFDNAVAKASGGGVFLITATWDDDSNGFVLDKTIEQIETAHTNGKLCVITGEINAMVSIADTPFGPLITINNDVDVNTTSNQLILTVYHLDTQTEVISITECFYTLTPVS